MRAFVEHRPPTPWKVWYAGPNFRYERPQKGRYRQFDQVDVEVLGTDDPEARRRGHRPRLALLRGARAAARSRSSSTPSATPDDRPRYVDALRAHFEARRRRPHRAEPRDARRATRCACSTRSGPRTPRSIAAAPVLGRLPLRRRGRRLRARAGRPRRARRPVHRRRPPRARPRLLRCARPSSSPAARSARRRTRSAAAAATTASSRTSAGRRRRASASPSASTARCWPATPRACSPRPTGAVDVFVVDVVGGATPPLLTDELRRAGLGADRAYDGRSMKAQMKKADRSGRRRRRHRRRGGASPTARVVVRDLRDGASRRPSPRDRRRRPRQEDRSPSMNVDAMRTHWCGELRPEHVGADVSACAAGWPAGASTASTSPSSTCATAPASCSASSTTPTTCAASTSCASPAPSRRPARGHGQPEPGHRRGRGRRLHRRGAARGRAAAVPDRRPGRRRRRGRPPALPLPRPPPRADAAQPARAGRRQHRHPRRDGAPGLRRGRDADAHAVDARGRPRVPRAVAQGAGLVLRAAAVARSCSSSC